MDSLIVGLVIEAQARELDAEVAVLRQESADAGVNAASPELQLLARELLARELHAIAGRLWGDDGQQRQARARP